MYNMHPYFSLRNLGKNVHIIHSKIYQLLTLQMNLSSYLTKGMTLKVGNRTVKFWEEWEEEKGNL